MSNTKEDLIFQEVIVNLFKILEIHKKDGDTFLYKNLYDEGVFGYYNREKVSLNSLTPSEGAKHLRDLSLRDPSLGKYIHKATPQAYVYISSTKRNQPIEIYFAIYGNNKHSIALRTGRLKKFTLLVEGRDSVTTFDTIINGLKRRLNESVSILV